MTDHEYINVFDAYRMYIFYFCKKFLHHQEDAEDITADVFIKLWENRDRILIKSAKAFLLVTANHKCQDKLKTSKHYTERISTFSFSDLHDIEIDTDVLNYIHELIETLTPNEKKIILLKYKDGKEVKRISKLLGIKPQTVSTVLNNGLNKLRAIIKNRGITLG